MGLKATNPNLSDPKTVKEALSRSDHKEWEKAIIKEAKSLESTGCLEWKLISTLPKGRVPLTGKWVFKIKVLPDGTVEKYKARWTARGFTQRKGLDYVNTFAPTPRAATGRILLSLSVNFGWKRRQVDVETAFLNPNLDKQIFIKPPEGAHLFKKDAHKYIIHVKKGLYGLKQAAALWHYDAVDTLQKLGLTRTVSDACLFQGKGILVLLHVDDFQIFGQSDHKIDKLIKGLEQKYTIKVVDTNVFLGLYLKEGKDGSMSVSQEHYSRDKLQGHGLSNAKSVKYPLDTLLEPLQDEGTKEDYDLFNKIIGELQHLSNHTRPDISFAVNHCARFLQNPGPLHVQAAKHIWRYVAGTIDKCLVYRKTKEQIQIEAFSDSDFAGDPSTSRSTSGMLFKIAGGPVVWRSQLQKEVVLSSTEAEYLSLTEATREVNWVRNLINELQPFTQAKSISTILIKVDNQSAISLVENHANSKRSRHVSLRNHYCREQHDKGSIKVEFVRTDMQLADCLTKPKSPNTIL
ncbi:retrovirus-related Pol polyprotein from transposon TNT 1-94 [Zymoseptoria brevis]|uniref:Retrovirus-related Pol polyprotein from transposon TNT 1-94 n=1 Tax=Zymoseptoria brevis TaxID=1047168 RepID=A0A0F4GH69_9PEZI|nr:retrovirus-related Pol polyprotein from transposon TNT 1-94 [Zymoseptoria brevis]